MSPNVPSAPVGRRKRAMVTKLGFVGIGPIGSHVTSRLLDAGYTLAVLDTNPDATRPAAARGFRDAATDVLGSTLAAEIEACVDRQETEAEAGRVVALCSMGAAADTARCSESTHRRGRS